jgi:hypothetical protein
MRTGGTTLATLQSAGIVVSASFVGDDNTASKMCGIAETLLEVFARSWLQRKGRTIAIDTAIIDYSLFHVCLSHGEYGPRRLGDRSHL